MPAPADSRPSNAPSGGLDARIAPIFSAFDRGESPGCAVGVYRSGEILYERGFGWANLERRERLTPSSSLPVASISKQFTAALIILLAREGGLSLDDDIQRFVPELPDSGRRITLRHLLHHTSGIADSAYLSFVADLVNQPSEDDEALLALLSRQPSPRHPPGEAFEYCNSGYFLLHLAARRVTDVTWEELLAQRVFRPLGMEHTRYFVLSEAADQPPATGYMQSGTEVRPAAVDAWGPPGAGGVVTTIKDLARWDRNFDDPVLGGRELIAALREPENLPSGERTKYGMGLELGEFRGLRSEGHSGDDLGFHATYRRLPSQRISVAVICNSSAAAAGVLADQVLDAVIPTAASSPRPGTEVSSTATFPSDPSALGAYVEESTLEERILIADGPKRLLGFGVSYVAPRELLPRDGREAQVAGSPSQVTLQRDEASNETQLVLTRGGVRRVFRRPMAIPPPQVLSSFEGTYCAKEFLLPMVLKADGTGLVVTSAKDPKRSVLRPLLPDRFKLDELAFLFNRNAAGEITGFTLRAPRLANSAWTRVPAGSPCPDSNPITKDV